MVEGTNLPPIQTSVFLRNFSLRSRLAQLWGAISVALLRRTTSKPGKFTNFKVLFSVVSTDFLSRLEKNPRGRVYSARDL